MLGRLAAALLCLTLGPGTAHGHFLLNTNVRVIHVEHVRGGLKVYLRLPMPLVVVGLIGPQRKDGTPPPPPFTRSVVINDKLMHFLDTAAVASDPKGLGRLVAEGHILAVDGKPLPPRIEAVRVHAAIWQPPFSTLEEARRALQGAPVPEGNPVSYVGDTVVDTALFYPADGPVLRYSLSSNLMPGLEGEDRLDNLVIDHATGEPRVYRVAGTMAIPIEVTRTALAAARTFLREGVLHIFGGLDHVLFIVCLVIGVVAPGHLVWSLTGFTLGHTVTLIVGFLGFTPSVNWFLPSVEVAIALSIVYAGVVALLRHAGRVTIATTATFGLLHGLGFSYALRQFLPLEAADLWLSLASFSIGIEVAQVAIVLVVWALLSLLNRRRPSVARYARTLTAAACTSIAVVWTGERVVAVVRATFG